MSSAWLHEAPNPWLKWAGLGVGGYTAAQFKYLALLAVATALSCVCRHHGSSFDSFSRFSSCKGAPDEIACFRKEAVLRMSFATFLFFALHILAIFIAAVIKGPDQDEVEKVVCALHSELFTLKLALFALLCTVVFLAIDYRVLKVYFHLSRCLACVYLLVQVVVLLETIFCINEELLSRDQCRWILVLSCATVYVGVITATVVLYAYFPWSKDCEHGVVIITVTLILILIMTVVSLASNRHDTGLLTSALSSAYAMYLCTISVITGATDTDCTSIASGTSTARWMVVLSFVVTLAALLISCFRTATSYGIFISGSTDAVELFNMNDLDNDLRRPVTTLIFHTLFTCASCFMLMVLTNWTLKGTPDFFDISRGTGSQWATAGTAWACCCIYIWIVIAPAVLPNRVFS